MDWKDHLEPYARELWDMEKKLNDLSDAHLSQLEWAVTKPTDRNCGAYTCYAAEMLAPMIERAQARRGVRKQLQCHSK